MVIRIRSLPVPIHSGEGELTAGQLNLKRRLNMRSFPDEVLAYLRCGSNICVLNGFTSSSTGCFPMNVQRGSSRPSDGHLRGKLSCQLHLKVITDFLSGELNGFIYRTVRDRGYGTRSILRCTWHRRLQETEPAVHDLDLHQLRHMVCDPPCDLRFSYDLFAEPF